MIPSVQAPRPLARRQSGSRVDPERSSFSNLEDHGTNLWNRRAWRSPGRRAHSSYSKTIKNKREQDWRKPLQSKPPKQHMTDRAHGHKNSTCGIYRDKGASRLRSATVLPIPLSAAEPTSAAPLKPKEVVSEKCWTQA